MDDSIGSRVSRSGQGDGSGLGGKTYRTIPSMPSLHSASLANFFV